MTRYMVVIERGDTSWGAHVPDLPGCIATAATIPEVESEIRDAIRFHLEGLKEDGFSPPLPTSIVEYVEA